MMRVAWLAMCVAFLMTTGCKEAPETPAPAPEKKTSTPASADQGSATLVLLRTSGLTMRAEGKKLTHGQLQHAKAQEAEAFVVEEPKLKAYVFSYQDSSSAAGAIQDLIGWINGSGLLHNGEAMANGRRIIVVGTPTPAVPDDKGKAAVNNLMDTFTATAAP